MMIPRSHVEVPASVMRLSALTQRAVLTAAALASALAGAQLTHVVLKPDTRIPEYKPKQ